MARTTTGKAPYITEDDLKLTLESQNGSHELRNQCVLYFSHFLGLRAKELALLTIEDVYDSKKNSLKETIRLLGKITKGNRYREVFLVNPTIKNLIQSYINQKSLEHRSPSSPLFLSQKGGAFTPNSMVTMIKNCYKKAGIQATSHSGRRSFATRLIQNGGDVYSIQQLMGHSSILTTQQYFATNPEHLRSIILKLN
ncbi:tyrosine-type recombinase/integrase [Acinetobacter sp. A47]|uniref:tyrosine-type recombinase/integrase n=1 Tax=Acinetobacter sp. A47 TaxID=1561217 RepID=UPI000570CBEF|nr:site-specific integrase [Acinetobacter sp. A47]